MMMYVSVPEDEEDEDFVCCPKCHGEGEILIAPEGFQVFEDDIIACPVCGGDGEIERWRGR